MRSQQLQCAIRSQLDQIAVIDSHEHTESMEFARSCRNHIFRTFNRSFIGYDLTRSDGETPRCKGAETKDQDCWESAKPGVDICRNTGYFRCFLIAVRDLLGIPIEELSDDNWERVSEALAEAGRREDWYRHVLRDRAHIDVVLWDLPPREPAWSAIDDMLFVPLARFDELTSIRHPQFRSIITNAFGVEPTTIGDLLDILEGCFRDAVEEGIAGVKIAAAYSRNIGFRSCSRAEASQIFNASASSLDYAQVLAFQDFMFSQIIERSIAHNLPIQIHTGMQSQEGFLHNGYPLYLEETVARYPKARFVLLHAGYPFTSHATTLAARYANVYVDGSWLPILSPSAYRHVLSEWLDVLPTERILAWGGDAVRVEMSYGSLVMAKDAIAEVLARKVEKGCFGEGKAAHIASRILRENLRELFGTDDVRNRRRRRPLAAKRVA